jgi:hypothetical protein
VQRHIDQFQQPSTLASVDSEVFGIASPSIPSPPSPSSRKCVQSKLISLARVGHDPLLSWGSRDGATPFPVFLAVTVSSLTSCVVRRCLQVISREANARRVPISDSFRIREETVPIFLGLIDHHLQRCSIHLSFESPAKPVRSLCSLLASCPRLSCGLVTWALHCHGPEEHVYLGPEAKAILMRSQSPKGDFITPPPPFQTSPCAFWLVQAGDSGPASISTISTQSHPHHPPTAPLNRPVCLWARTGRRLLCKHTYPNESWFPPPHP